MVTTVCSRLPVPMSWGRRRGGGSGPLFPANPVENGPRLDPLCARPSLCTGIQPEGKSGRDQPLAGWGAVSARGVTGQRGQPAVGGTDEGLRLCTGGRARTHRPKPPTLVGGHCPGPASQPRARVDMPVFPFLLTMLASTAWRPFRHTANTAQHNLYLPKAPCSYK